VAPAAGRRAVAAVAAGGRWERLRRGLSRCLSDLRPELTDLARDTLEGGDERRVGLQPRGGILGGALLIADEFRAVLIVLRDGCEVWLGPGIAVIVRRRGIAVPVGACRVTGGVLAGAILAEGGREQEGQHGRAPRAGVQGRVNRVDH
jgi:hypothetical protein